MLNILSGYESANIKSLPYKAGTSLVDGTWVVFGKTADAGKLIAQAGDYSAATDGKAFVVSGGNDVRFDSKEMGNISVVTAKSFVGETDKFAAVSIYPGMPLTLKDGALVDAEVTAAEQGERTYKITNKGAVGDKITIAGVEFTAVTQTPTGPQFVPGETIAVTTTNLEAAVAATTSITTNYTVTKSLADTIDIIETSAGGGHNPAAATVAAGGVITVVNTLVETSAAQNTKLDVVAYALTSNTSGVLQFVGA